VVSQYIYSPNPSSNPQINGNGTYTFNLGALSNPDTITYKINKMRVLKTNYDTCGSFTCVTAGWNINWVIVYHYTGGIISDFFPNTIMLNSYYSG
jgi:hypothetical protein